MLVVIVAPVHVWDDVRVFKKEAISLVRAGYRVKLIARIEQSAVIEDVEIIPAAGSYKNRVLRFFSIPFIFYQALKLKANIYHLHNPDTIPIAFLLKLFGCKVIYDTHEDFTKKILTRPWLPTIFRKPMASIVGYTEYLVSNLVNVSIATQSDVAYRLGKKSRVIENTPRIDKRMFFKVNENKKFIHRDSNEFRVIYIGVISINRGLIEMVSALEIVNIRFKCRLWLIGEINKKELETIKNNKGWSYVDYFPRMEQEKAFSYVAKSDAGLIYIRDIGGYSETDPNKIYEYMAFSIPFIASDFKKWRTKFGSINAGIFIEPEDSEKLANGIIRLASLPKSDIEVMGKNGKSFVLKNNWEKESRKLLAIYEKLN